MALKITSCSSFFIRLGFKTARTLYKLTHRNTYGSNNVLGLLYRAAVNGEYVSRQDVNGNWVYTVK